MAGKPIEPQRGKPKALLSAYGYFGDSVRKELRENDGRTITFPVCLY